MAFFILKTFALEPSLGDLMVPGAIYYNKDGTDFILNTTLPQVPQVLVKLLSVLVGELPAEQVLVRLGL